MADVTVSTSVPDVTLSDIGIALPDELDILNGRLSDLDTAMGGGMSKSLTTPQGQIAMSDTAIIADKNAALAWLMSQINPDFASGRMQDAIGRVYFMDRISAQGTVVTATCTGLVGTQIPAGSVAQDSEGYLYSSLSSAVIPAGGAVDIQFQNQTPGPIPCPAGSLNTIFRAVTGWSGVNNLSAGAVGVDVENRISFEKRRQQSVARNGRNMDASTLAGLLAVDGVLDAYVWSNRTSATVNHGVTNFPVAPHSIYIGVYGGSDEDVAESIFETKNPGANLNGNTQYVVEDRQNYSAPYPQYTMQWQRATPVRVRFRVSIETNQNLPSDITQRVRAMVESVFNGEYTGIVKARIGSRINSGVYYAPVISVSPDYLNISSLLISTDGQNYLPSVTVGVDQMPTIQQTDIEVVMV
ncbi:baseplate J/gp47 family protein [Pseudescherichia vulneris]|uniref:baseplate J/gp47 family protein n=1 Tax=Pseudescherichia vulneris TaxID=566 RepID=UPI00227A93BC|nr:baseplate J/gp47 family protein [Pseudescherichia vulneris]WAH52628.1 baseplate J/gp47 family protein [Pseudescherichia vulneris]